MSLYNHDSQFARIHNGEVVEWPVLYEHILNRRLPLRLFRQISFGPKPEASAYAHLQEDISLVNGVPTVTYTQRPYTLEEVLVAINEQAPVVDGVFSPPSIASVDPVAIGLVSSLTRDEISRRLDNFAKTRWYDSIATLVTYVNDPDPQQKYEGERGVALRSQCWVSIRAYETGVVTGTIPVPRTVNEIYAQIPELTWGDEPVAP